MKFIKEEFLKKYKATSKFAVGDNVYYASFLDLLENDELLSHIKFANDVLGVAPIKTFVLYVRDYKKEDLFNEEMSDYDKQSLGACFGYLYEFMSGGYVPKKIWFGDEKTKIKSASRFVRV